MKKQTVKRAGRVGCIALAAVLALSTPGAALANAASVKKDETVYISLDSSGKTQSTIVSDWLHAENGTQQIADKTDLENIQNVKSNEKAVRNGDALSWVLNTDNTGKNIYYQGTTTKSTPLAISVDYTLNGKSVTADEIAGKSGKVTIRLTIRNNSAQTVSVNGKTVSMYTPMTAIAAAILPTDTFQNVTVNSGKVVTDGNNQFVVFVTMPGLSESLNLKNCGIPELSSFDFPETLTIEADAVKFHLSPIAVAATPKLVDSDKLATSDNLNDLISNLHTLKSIQSDLENADPEKDLTSLITDPDRTAAARLLIDDVFDFYRLDTTALDLLPQYVNDSTFQLADRVTSDLSKADLKYLLESNVLTNAANSLSRVDTKKAQTLLDDYNTLSSLDTTKLNSAKKLLNDYSKVSGGLNNVLGDTGRLVNSVDTDALTTLEALGSSGVKNSLTGTLSSMNSLTNILAQYGVTSAEFDEADVQALLESYLSRNFSTLAGNAIKKYSTDGAISVKNLSAVLTSFGLDSATQAALLQQLGAAMGTSLGQDSMIPDSAVLSLLAKLPAETQKAMISSLAGTLANELTPSVNALLTDSAQLQAKLTNALGSNYANEISKAVNSLSSSERYLEDLQTDLSKLTWNHQSDLDSCMAEAEALLSHTSDLSDLLTWAGKLEKMKGDLDDNRENIAILTSLMKTASDPKVKSFAAMLPTLQTDLKDSYAAATPLLNAMNRPSVKASLNQLPTTAKTLLKIEKDVNGNRDLMNTLRRATEPSTVSLLRSSLNSLTSLEKSGTTDLTATLDNIDDLLARKDAYLELADKNSIFTEAADGTSTEVKYVYETAEVKVPEAKTTPTTVSTSQQKSDSGNGFWQWLSSIFRKLKLKWF